MSLILYPLSSVLERKERKEGKITLLWWVTKTNVYDKFIYKENVICSREQTGASNLVRSRR